MMILLYTSSSGFMKCTSHVPTTGLLNCSPSATIFRLISFKSSSFCTFVIFGLSIMKERAEARELEAEKLRSRVRQLEDELHELKMQKRITALAPRDGSADPEKVLRGLLGGGDL